MARLIPLKPAFAASVLVLLAGCGGTALQSETFDADNTLVSGPVYALPRSLVTLAVNFDGTALSMTASAEHVADVRHRYKVNHLRSAAANDDFQISVDSKGLLGTTTAQTTDETPAVLEKVVETTAELGAAFMKTATNADRETTPQPGVQPSEVSCGTGKAFSIEQTIDPLVPEDVIRLNTALKAINSGCQITVGLLDSRSIPGTLRENGSSTVEDKCDGSYCFRLPVPLRVALKDNKKTMLSRLVTIADPSITGRIMVERAACSILKTDITFSSGMLTSVKINRPSTLLNCVSVPSRVIAAGVSGLTTGLKNRDTVDKAF